MEKTFNSNSDIKDDLLLISVVIPVYNASKFVSQAVESALVQSETAEIILVEDGSTDNSYTVCQSLSKKFPDVHLYTHHERQNKGAGASRNLGIRKANYDWIAFLDADDFYLENRFKFTGKVLHEKKDADGIYEAIGVHYESGGQDDLLNKRQDYSLTTIENCINPDELFWKQSPIGSKGYTSLDGLTIKKKALLEVGLFSPKLRLHQDTDLFMKLAMGCKLYPGLLNKPVAMRRVHQNNRITQNRSIEQTIQNYKDMFEVTYSWALERGYFECAEEIKTQIKYCRVQKAENSNFVGHLGNIYQHLTTLKEYPGVLFEYRFYKYLIRFLLKYLRRKITQTFI